VKDDRLRIPVEAKYVSAIGLATFAFVILEWNAVWCCERMTPGIISSLADRTAGGVAKKLIELATLRSATVTDDLLPAANEFQSMVLLRNNLLHAKPGADGSGTSRLFRNGQLWTIDTINDAADAFTACSIRLNALLHGPLQQP
jgi:hypothetical protein